MSTSDDQPYSSFSAPGTVTPESLLEGLNPPQREAVTTLEGPVLVLAGPGSGKTRVITHRIAYLLLERPVSPWNVLAVTFTNKAAREMKERLERLIGEPGRDLAVGTFHSICSRVLRREAEQAGLGLDRHFSIYDDDDQIALVRQILNDMNLDTKQYNPRAIHSLISKAKNDLYSPVQYAERVNKYFEEIAARVYARYEELLRQNNAADFDDLILLTYQLWRRNSEVLAQYQRRYRYLHVDEFQDTNKAQYELVRLLAAGTPEVPGHGNICTVADDDQCLIAGTLITMADGSERPIEDVAAGDSVLSGYGGGDFGPARVQAVARREREGMGIRITTRAGRTLVSTPEHTHFAGYRLGITPQLYFTYLMHKRGVGYRLGTSQVYTRGQVKSVVGFMQRTHQEHADAAWIVSAHASENEARVDEYILSLRYGIPTLPFVPRTGGSINGLVHDGRYIRRVFEAFDTVENAQRLLRDVGLSAQHPHYRPRSRNSNRMHLVITLCADRRGAGPRHAMSLVANSERARDALESLGLRVRTERPGVNSWSYEASSADMAVLLERAERIGQVADVELVFQARLGLNQAEAVGGNSLPFLPAASVRPGMALFDAAGGYDVVERVETVPLDAPVYDLDIERSHNFIANGIVTHNSIYSWRGANPRVLLQMEQDFPGTRVILLEQNYRSTQVILDAAQGVVRRNEGRKDKKLWTKRTEGEQIVVHEAYNEEAEASYVADEIRRLAARAGGRLRDVAVMYRTNAQSRALEEQFMRVGLPYVVIGSKKFYERKEIKDVLAYLRLIANPQDTISLQRIINVPNRKIGPKTWTEFQAWAEREHLTPVEALARVGEHPTLATAGKRALANFAALLDDLITKSTELKLPELLDRLTERSGYQMDLLDGTEEGAERWNNVLELRRVADDFAEIEPATALMLFLEQVALVAGSDVAQTAEAGTLAHEEQRDAATLITLHAAKGLEFPVVFIVGLEEGILPHARSLERQQDLEEERRLAYVGITRAMHRLYLVRAIRRTFYGGSNYQEPSRFLQEIPKELMKRTGAAGGRHASGIGGGARAGSGWGGAGGASLGTRPAPGPGGRAYVGTGSGGIWTVGSRDAGAVDAGIADADAAADDAPPAEPLKPGDRVSHRMFGPGLVLKVETAKGATTVEVLFDRAGKKTLDVAFANLQKI
ncbi:MAG TPA: UvrD-helicase domain-containing protein [Ktedonobacterales bacterium]